MDEAVLLHARACLIPRKKNYMKRGHIDRYIDRYIDGQCDSMKELARGRFFENFAFCRHKLSEIKRIIFNLFTTLYSAVCSALCAVHCIVVQSSSL